MFNICKKFEEILQARIGERISITSAHEIGKITGTLESNDEDTVTITQTHTANQCGFFGEGLPAMKSLTISIIILKEYIVRIDCIK